MFKFWYEKFLMRFSYVVAFMAFMGVFVYAYVLEVGHDENVEKQSFQQIVAADLGTGGKIAQTIDKPHRADKELKDWVSVVISESLTVDPYSFEQTKKNISRYFTASGLVQYEGYLDKSSFLQNLKDSQKRTSVFVEQPPLLLNNGEVNGVYRWLYQAPVTVSFIPRNANGYSRDVVSRQMTLQVQLRRVKADEYVEGMRIESWSVTARR